MVDLVKIRNEIKNGELILYISKDKVYLKDAENDETIIICDLKVENEKHFVC